MYVVLLLACCDVPFVFILFIVVGIVSEIKADESNSLL